MTVHPSASLIDLDVAPGEVRISQGHAYLRAGLDGVVDGGRTGLFGLETRVISRWRWSIEGRRLNRVASSPVEQHAWLGYLLAVPPGIPEEGGPLARALGDVHADVGIEVRIARFLGRNLHEDLTLVNWSGLDVRFELILEVDGDFASQEQVLHGLPPHGRVERRFAQVDLHVWALDLHWRAERAWQHQGEAGTTVARRAARVRWSCCDGRPRWEDGRLRFQVHLPPRGRWRVCSDVTMEGVTDRPGPPIYACATPTDASPWAPPVVREGTRTVVSLPGSTPLGELALAALDRARHDLAALRLHDDGAVTFAAGAPLYVALFGRDALTTSWQSAMLDPRPMLGTLAVLARWQGRRDDPWRDEEPGKMLHERHLSPTELLHDRPMDRYYGSITTSAFFPVVVGQAWHWLGHLDEVAEYVEPALEALRWLDTSARREDGFYAYLSRSEQGVRHQAWKDAPAAIVRADGTDVGPPLATCEEQGFVHLAKQQLAEVLFWLGRREEARTLRQEAKELKARFERAYWMPEQGFYALALDAEGRQVDAIASNPGHCLATGIVADAHVTRVAGRMLSPDLFSGWGVRTLSCDNPAYNPFSYHRGSVWPVENGTFVLGFVRYGLHDHAERLARALFEAAALFPALRLPEAFAGHPRDGEHPFPALYPAANAPQAWSASAVACVLQALLGLYPYAPAKLLFVDPHLPAWLPRLRIAGLMVGDARVTLLFERDPRSGRTTWKVEDREGIVRVVRQPSPWSLTAGPLERTRDLIESLRPRGLRPRSGRRARA